MVERNVRRRGVPHNINIIFKSRERSHFHNGMHRKLGAWLVCFHSTLSPSFLGYTAYTYLPFPASLPFLFLPFSLSCDSPFLFITIIRFQACIWEQNAEKGLLEQRPTPQNAIHAIPRVSHVMDETRLYSIFVRSSFLVRLLLFPDFVSRLVRWVFVSKYAAVRQPAGQQDSVAFLGPMTQRLAFSWRFGDRWSKLSSVQKLLDRCRYERYECAIWWCALQTSVRCRSHQLKSSPVAASARPPFLCAD